MAIDKKEFKKYKDMATKLLKFDGIDYDTWINEKHKELIMEKSDVVNMSLEMLIDSKND